MSEDKVIEKEGTGNHIPSYPKVYNLGHAAIRDIFFEDVIVEEKVDGSQFSFGRLNDTLVCRSHDAIVYPESAPKLFRGAVATAERIFPFLGEGVFIRGEAFQSAHHNVLTYGRAPKGGFVLFDINNANEEYLDREHKEAFAVVHDVEIVPIIFSGKLTSTDEVTALLDRESFLGGTKIEGLVVKNYKRFTRDGKAMFGKYVSEKFKETHKEKWGESNPSQKGIVDRIIEGLRTETRWQKIVQHLDEAGKLKHEPKDIGLAVIELKKDIYEENHEEIANRLFQEFADQIYRGAFAGFPEWYKKQLLERQFTDQK
jgi:ATP-dependent RNA circularization protein (DNA/RNA ligase family)